MPLLGPSHAIAYTDKMSAIYNCFLGTSGSGLGLGDGTYGASLKALNLRAIFEGSSNSIFADADLGSVLDSPVLLYGTANLANTVFNSTWGSTAQGPIDSLASRAKTVSSTISDLDSMMYWYNYLNGATYWQCLASPDWYYTFQAFKNGVAPNALNCYYVIAQGGTYRGTTFTNGVAKWVITGASTGTFTAGSSVPAGFAGGYAFLNFAGVTGTGVVTVVGTDQNGNAETWTYTIAGASGNAQMTPQTHSYSLIKSVTSISCAAGLTAGTLYVESHAPAGRTFPTT